jgi:inner membrane protein
MAVPLYTGAKGVLLDTLTQGLLGAAVGQACCGRSLGRRAMVYGALGGLLPDLDILSGISQPLGEFLYHRGPTHALWVGPVIGPVLGYAMWRATRRAGPSQGSSVGTSPQLRAWVTLFVLVLLTHPLLDVFTTYGTQLLSPFSNHRFALNAVGIVDPAYSVLLVAALVVGRVKGPGSRSATRAAVLCLLLSSGYLLGGLWLNHRAEQHGREQLAREGWQATSVTAYPTLFQPFLRRIVARGDDRVRVGWLSLWSPHPISWEEAAVPQHPLIEALERSREGRVFAWFAMDQTFPRVLEGDAIATVEIDDIRYGFPGPAGDGLWGIRGRFDARGRLLAPVERFHRPLPLPAGAMLANILRYTFD